jgi:dipeptidyl-peptidase 4
MRLTRAAAWVIAASLILSPNAPLEGQVTAEDYRRAEQFLPWNIRSLALNVRVEPNWLPEGERFWYRRELSDGSEFLVVDAERGERRPAFDHARLADALRAAADQPIAAERLPFQRFESAGMSRIAFDAYEGRWTCDLGAYVCAEEQPGARPRADELVSPDGRWAAHVRDHDLYVRSLLTGQETRLTTDGEPYHDYGRRPEARQNPIRDRIEGVLRPPAAVWSPDSRRLVTHRLDQRYVGEFALIQSVPGPAQVVHTYRMPLPGDPYIPMASLIVFDIAVGTATTIDGPQIPAPFWSPFDYQRIWWSEDSEEVYIIRKERGAKAAALQVAIARTGAIRTILEEHSTTFVELNIDWSRGRPNVRVLGDGAEVIWFSERDGWGHLYLYDGGSGQLKNQITHGDWVVRNLVHVDEANRLVYFTGAGREPGRDPYYRHLYRIGLDGSDLELLTPEDADHSVMFSPSGRYFVDSYSRIDTIPVSVLRSTTDGRVVKRLEAANLDLLFATGWTWPERFSVKARDGVTDLYGAIFRPTNHDPGRKYAVIDDFYPGPQTIRTPKSFDAAALGSPQALAELGFIVVTLDGMGTALRSKAFHDVSYNNFEDATLPDHIAGLRQLALRDSTMNLDRVGIFGGSAGGYGSVRAILEYPDFFKAAVSHAGNTTMRSVLANWAEKWQGYPVTRAYDRTDLANLARNLRGRLLIGIGDMDDTVPPSQTLQLVHALIEANKDFDLLVMPNRHHAVGADPYFIRRRWDFFVQHLLDAEPPPGIDLRPTAPRATASRDRGTRTPQ